MDDTRAALLLHSIDTIRWVLLASGAAHVVHIVCSGKLSKALQKAVVLHRRAVRRGKGWRRIARVSGAGLAEARSRIFALERDAATLRADLTKAETANGNLTEEVIRQKGICGRALDGARSKHEELQALRDQVRRRENAPVLVDAVSSPVDVEL